MGTMKKEALQYVEPEQVTRKLERDEHGRYMKGPMRDETVARRAAIRALAMTARKAPRSARPDGAYAPKNPTRRAVVLPEELVRALIRTLGESCDVSLEQDREVYVASLKDHHNGTTVAANRSPELALVDVIGKRSRAHVA
jgi:hypothetical protein